ncbi:ArsR/SmtB family transcription factor [Flexivirga meconopsidis]|uniref:ArsR/SmtB family transcription factor n=1 Tax=Flexivirga meconopsidis TaxID=2977121 RepID=UPI00223F3148|nr:winged helix-turn-helix domain-containing protein [Flexivirga meconopsidis]
MGLWEIPSDVLAGAQFAVSPMAEVVGALGYLTGARSRPDEVFAARHRAAFHAMLDEHPMRAAVLDNLWHPSWMADFLSIPPPTLAPSFTEELEQVMRLGDKVIRAHLRESTPHRLPKSLERPGLTEHVVGLLEWTWTHTVASDWPRREGVLRADITTRTHRLAAHGFAGVLRDLGKRRDWERGHLRINNFDLPTRRLSPQARLLLVPVHAGGSWVGWDEPHRYAVYYPVGGALAQTGATTADGLDQLLGRNRARILRLLQSPQTTSGLAAQTGLPLGAVGNHLRILLRSGAVLKRRSGREVIYWRTALGDDLVAASSA